MVRNRTFQVLSNLILLVVVCTRQVAAAPNNSANKVERYSSPNISDAIQNTRSNLQLDTQAASVAYTAISVGLYHTCGLTSIGGVKCWGKNFNGELGNNTNTDSKIPVDVYGLTSGVSAIDAGYSHTCALTSGGGVKCWGSNAGGNLGTGIWNGSSNVPLDVVGLTNGVKEISAAGSVTGGFGHTCVVTSDDSVKCWGDSASSIPVNVSGLTSGVSKISAGNYHTCALTIGGSVKCWGGNTWGMLGDGTDSPRDTLVNVYGLTSGVSHISAGLGHTCAVTSGGSLKCWGLNRDGELGDGTNTDRYTPVSVIGLFSGISASSAGYWQTCAITNTGGAKCWGDGNLGNETINNSNVPIDVYGLTSGVYAIDVGYTHTCAVTSSGARCWGSNFYGELGDGTNSDSIIPVNVYDSIAPPIIIFADVPFNYWANSYIERLYNAGITGGCSVTPLSYCPDNTVTRAQMAVFLLKGIHGSSYSPPDVGVNTGFTDVPVGYWAASWIKRLAAEGITGGCGAGIYCPDATVTRAQMAVFLLKGKHGTSYSPPAASGVFTDVPVGYWARNWIEQLAVEGITGGCGAGVYCPDAGVTRAQMAVFLVKTFNLP